MPTKRIGVLTSGGDCPGLNAVIRGVVKASRQLGYDCVGFLKGYEGLYDPVQYIHLTADSTRGILNQGGTILGSTNKGRFAATVGVDDRQELDPALVEGVKQTIDQLGIDGLVCVGGDGSLAVAQQFHENGIPVVGVPKTIDNDLSATAFTFGFDSAIECATDALDRLHTTAASHERIMVLEVMGRHAGWIALHSGIAGGGDVILIPEIEWNWDHVCHKILHRESQGKKFTLVVVAEGAELPGSGLVGESRSGQQMKLGGVGRAVSDEIARRLHRETRLSVLGHLQRGGKPTTFDRVLATQFGAHAVRLVHEGRFGEMICSCPPDMKSVPIIEAVNELRRVDPHGPAVQAARALGISFGDRGADEIGQNVFDRRDELPSTHVAEYLEHQRDEATPPPAETVVVEAAHADEPLTEDEAADDVAETVLDLVADADEAIHGAVAEPEGPSPSSDPVEEVREAELPETDTCDSEEEQAAAEAGANEPEAATPPALEIDPVAEPSPVLEVEEPVEEPEKSAKPPADFAAAQVQLAQRIAEAAKASRDQASGETVADPEREEATLAKKGAPRPADALDSPHGEDLVSDARSALEEALAD